VSPTSRLIEQFVQDDVVLSHRTAARVLSWLYVAAGVVGLLTLLMPQDHRDAWPYVAALCAAAIGVGFVLARWNGRANGWILDASLALGSGFIAVGIALDDSVSSSTVAFFTWSSLFAFFFLSFRRAMLQLAVIGALYAALLTYLPSLDPLDHFFTQMAVLLGVGPMVGLVRRRIVGFVDDLEDAADFDALTRVLNRRGFGVALERAMLESRDTGEALSIAVADVDYFKEVNDQYGHGTGDDVLVLVARELREAAKAVWPGSQVGRTGGEEFGVVLPGCSAEQAWEVCEHLRSTIELEGIGQIDITISLGVVTRGRDGETTTELLTHADESLMAAKAFGRNRTVAYGEEVRSLLPRIAARRDVGREMHLATLVMLAEVLDMRDGGTSNHSRCVGRMCEEMAIRLGLDNESVDRIRVAGVLHDIGKVGIPDALLLKPAALTNEEWEQMRSHPEVGARILASMSLRDIRSYVMHHHERVDGAGYPQGLGGEEIPLGARIVSVADSFEAMVAERPYKQAMHPADALAELRRCAGTQFDPSVVEAFISAVDDGAFDDLLLGGDATWARPLRTEREAIDASGADELADAA
jgi:diguanylate cyclase (GGDEF)-like protein/putative nucleotidyltransferase with HDIG domain